ncbi:MAG: hypothetical protein K2N87_08825 [Eubacterium sp.]|nr:hypothetical protein [Eubacterium sp.]
MTNISQQKRLEILKFLQTIREEHKYNDDALITIEQNKHKKMSEYAI